MICKANDLSYKQFEKIGMSKREVLAMPSEDSKTLLLGRTTNLQSIRIKNQDIEQAMQVKISVQRFADGSLNLLMHPIRNEIKNEDKLSDSQLEKLRQGETVIAPKKSMNGEKELHLFQLDRETNENVKTRLNSITVSRYLMDMQLTPQNKSDLLQGRTITLEDKLGSTQVVAIDLIDPKGYVLKNADQKQQMTVAPNESEDVKLPSGVKR